MILERSVEFNCITDRKSPYVLYVQCDQLFFQILRGGNGIIVGGQSRLRGSSSKSTSTKSTSTSSLTKISKTHRVSKGGSSSRSSRMSKSDTKPPKQITPQYGKLKINRPVNLFFF